MIARLDRLLTLLTDWTIDLAPVMPARSGVAARTFVRCLVNPADDPLVARESRQGGAGSAVGASARIAPPVTAGYVVTAWLVGSIVTALIPMSTGTSRCGTSGSSSGLALAHLAAADAEPFTR